MNKRNTQSARRATSINHVCKRCGQCCIGVGKSFWTHSGHELVNAMCKRLVGDFYDDTGRCDMLLIHENGQATCLLQKWLGHNGKPEACRKYPFDGAKGQRGKGNNQLPVTKR